jgi:hypothetical protein
MKAGLRLVCMRISSSSSFIHLFYICVLTKNYPLPTRNSSYSTCLPWLWKRPSPLPAGKHTPAISRCRPSRSMPLGAMKNYARMRRDCSSRMRRKVNCRLSWCTRRLKKVFFLVLFLPSLVYMLTDYASSLAGIAKRLAISSPEQLLSCLKGPANTVVLYVCLSLKS